MIDPDDQWIIDNVPEAATAETRATLYAIGRHLDMMLGQPDRAVPTAEMRAHAWNKASAAVVVAWERLEQALASHPTYALVDHLRACDRRGVDLAEAEKYAMALRDLVDHYRTPRLTPRKKDGRPAARRTQFLMESVRLVRDVLQVNETRAAAIVAAMAARCGVQVSAASIRQTSRNRRAMK
jgi:hypothetical protein